jgi:hypothetical protein
MKVQTLGDHEFELEAYPITTATRRPASPSFLSRSKIKNAEVAKMTTSRRNSSIMTMR